MITVSKTLWDAYERGYREGFEKTLREGETAKLIQRMLHRVFTFQLNRALTAREQEALAEWALKDPVKAQAQALSLEGEAIAAWLVSSVPVGAPPPRPRLALRARRAR